MTRRNDCTERGPSHHASSHCGTQIYIDLHRKSDLKNPENMSMNDVRTPKRLPGSLHDGRFPNESSAYRQARDALLIEEITLRRHAEAVAARRRALPPGGQVREDYVFEGESGAVRLSELFGEHRTLITYHY